VIVELDPPDLWLGRKAASGRMGRARKLGLKDAHGFRGDGEAINLDGTLAELAVAKGLDYFFRPLGHLPGEDVPDVGPFQIRSTRWASGKLIVYESDPDDPFLLVVVESEARFRIAGWIEAAEAKNPDFWNPEARDPSFWIPQSALRPIGAFQGARAA
jgi:hypothetical protein